MIDDDLDLPVDEPGQDADESENPGAVVPDYHGHGVTSLSMAVQKAGTLAQVEPAPLDLPEPVALLVSAAANVKPPSVPRPRAIHLGTKGLDVVAVKRALSRADWMTWGAFTPLFGEAAVKALRNFQHHHGIEASGAYGVKSHIALVHSLAGIAHQGEWAFDDYSIFLMRSEAALLAGTPEQRVRKAMLACGYFLYTHRDAIPYVQTRPFPLKKPPFVPSSPGIDCSAYYTLCSFAGGAPDPNGRGYDGQGYTGTLMNRGRRCTLAELKPGDAVFYGFTTRPSPAFPYGSPTHVAMYVGGGMVLSNGSHPMGHYPVGYRSDLNHFRTYEMGGL